MPNDTPTADRRGFLKCMTWAGSAMVWTMTGGIPRAHLVGDAKADSPGFSFAQVSDSHLGFDKPVNTNVTGTFQEALGHVTGSGETPAFLIHTGDITHLSKPEQFDTAAQLLSATKLQVYTVPGEHDVLEDDGKSYLNHYGKGTKGDGWYSFNAHGVHFIGLVNVVNLQGNGLGDLGHAQPRMAGAGRERSAGQHPDRRLRACAAVDRCRGLGLGHERRRAGTHLSEAFRGVLTRAHPSGDAENRGACRVHTARSTAFPPGHAGVAKGPGPMPVPPGQLKTYLGTTRVSFVQNTAPLAIVDTPLMG